MTRISRTARLLLCSVVVLLGGLVGSSSPAAALEDNWGSCDPGITHPTIYVPVYDPFSGTLVPMGVKVEVSAVNPGVGYTGVWLCIRVTLEDAPILGDDVIAASVGSGLYFPYNGWPGNNLGIREHFLVCEPTSTGCNIQLFAGVGLEVSATRVAVCYELGLNTPLSGCIS